jgi:hypothetical protein
MTLKKIKCSIFNSKLYLNVGNPNINDLLSGINSKLSGYLTCTYDNIRNKITYTGINNQTSNYYTMYNNAINSGCFLDSITK